jgi:2,3-bisphosphoglycerate-independent phosphoglycerate mutase
MSLEIPIIRVPGTTGDYKSDLGAKARAAIEHIALDEYDFGFVHVKAVDDTGHDRNTQLKVLYFCLSLSLSR